jgi:hypothetical protein
VCELFTVVGVDEQGEISVQPIADPNRIDAVLDTTSTHTFDYSTTRPKIKRYGPPWEPSHADYSDPTTWCVIHAMTTTGEPASNVGIGYTTSVTSITVSNNKLEGMSIAAVTPTKGTYFDSAFDGCPTIGLDYAFYATATITFTTTSTNNRLDLGSVPSAASAVEMIGEAVTPDESTITYSVRATSGDSWTTYNDGDTLDDISVAANQTYEVEAILTPDTGKTVTPILRTLGAREVAIKDLSDIAEVVQAGWAVDPVELKGEIPECTIRAIRDGVRDFNDQITDILSTYNLGDIQFRLWVGGSSIDRQYWMKLDDYLLDDYQCEAGAIVLTCISPLALAKAILPKYNTSTNDRSALFYNNADTWTLKDTYEDLRDNQIEVAARWVGQSIEDDTTQVHKLIDERTEGKDELDAIAFLAGGAVVSRQGRLAFVDMYADKSVAAVFPSDEIQPTLVTPGYANRIPEVIVEYDWDEDERRYESVEYGANGAALVDLGIARLDAPKHIPDPAAKYIAATNAQTLAQTVADRWVERFAFGLVLLGFKSIYAHPELELGDMVAVETDSFVAIDPNTSNAVKGRLWIPGVIVEIGDVIGTEFTVWVKDYRDIINANTAGTVDVGFKRARAEVETTTNQSILNGRNDPLDWHQENYDEGACISVTSTSFTVPQSGRYRVEGKIKYNHSVDWSPDRAIFFSAGTAASWTVNTTALGVSVYAEVEFGGFGDYTKGDTINLNVANPDAGGTGATVVLEGSIFRIERVGIR